MANQYQTEPITREQALKRYRKLGNHYRKMREKAARGTFYKWLRANAMVQPCTVNKYMNFAELVRDDLPIEDQWREWREFCGG